LDLPPDLRAVSAAILAASPHSTQSWWFDLSSARVDVHVDDTRDLGAMDSRGRERRIGVGCALENLTIAASRFGLLGAPTGHSRPAEYARHAAACFISGNTKAISLWTPQYNAC